jgi:pyruvate,water dikinase
MESYSQWIAWFEEFGKEHTHLVGSKNASLGEMMRLGVPVPSGFAVTTVAYSRFIEQTGADKEIEQCMSEFIQKQATLNDYREMSRKITEITLSREIPAEIKDGICQSYYELSRKYDSNDVPVAVRSSGVAEDLPTASFAGQYESFLYVTGKDELVEKVKNCWASFFTDRSIIYRIKNDLPVLAGSISVGIQKMIDARSAGVGFTVHPGTGDDTEIMLEGNWGTGESVVQGLTVPDQFIINKDTLTIKKKVISCKLKQIVRGKKGTEERLVSEDRRSVPCLSVNEALKIAEFAKSLEKSLRGPLDIEWAIDKTVPFPQNIFLVQARPVTKVAEKKDAIDRILDMMLAR